MRFLSISPATLESGIKHRQSVAQGVRCRCNSRRQLVDRLAHGSIEIVQPLPVQYPFEGGADVGADQPKFDAIRPVDQLVLSAFQSTICRQETRRKPTLIVERITPTEPKTVLAGAIAGASFARFKVWMAVFNAEMGSPRSLGRWDPTSMVETRDSRERTMRRGRGAVRKVWNPNRPGRQICYVHSVERDCTRDCGAEGRVCVCVCLLYSVQLGGQRSPLSTTGNLVYLAHS